MKPVLYAHPFSSYCQKVLIALYENATAFEFRMLDGAAAMAELAALWPLRRFPVLADAGRTVMEASIIIEHLDLHHPGRLRFVPADPGAALEVRLMDRFFDNYIMAPMQQIVFDARRLPDRRHPDGVAEARTTLDTAYGWLEARLKHDGWACGEFGLADCAAAPALFYADWAHPIGEAFAKVRAYRHRLLARASFARAVDEARPYRPLFPLGAPDRD
jgi:glutathione S-transferase